MTHDNSTPTNSDNAPLLGETIMVIAPEGRSLINNETGIEFVSNTPTSQLVTITTLRRLSDGDLVRV